MVVCFHVPFIKNTKEKKFDLLSITLLNSFPEYYICYLTLFLTHRDGIVIWFNYSRSLFSFVSPVILYLSSTWMKLWNESSKSIMWVRETSSGESVQSQFPLCLSTPTLCLFICLWGLTGNKYILASVYIHFIHSFMKYKTLFWKNNEFPQML